MKNVHKIEIKLEGEIWQKCLDNSFKKAVKEAKIDGFRKGSAPKDIYLKKYGIESLYPDAINDAVGEAYKKLIDENKDLKPVVEPEVDVTGISDGSVIFNFTIITKPEIKLDSYKKLGVKKEKVKVTKEEVESEIESLRTELAEIVVKENAVVADGDTVVIDFEGYVDGKALEGGKGENYPLEIGSHTFIPGFEEGLIGKKENEKVELNLKFPENYVEDLKNKDVTFNVTIHEIKTKVLPELGEEFYADLGIDVKTKEEFESEIEKNITKRKETELEDKFIEELLTKATEKLEVEINPEIISDEVHRMIDNYANQLKMQGMSIEQYYQFTGTTHEDLHNQMEPEAIKRIKYRYVIEEIAEAEKIDFTEKEVQNKAKEMAENYGITVDELISAYGTIDVVKYDMKMHRALEILKESNM